MKIMNNVTDTVRDDLIETVHKGSKLSIAAACFSIYAYQELRKQLDSVEQVRFIFTSPTFVEQLSDLESITYTAGLMGFTVGQSGRRRG